MTSSQYKELTDLARAVPLTAVLAEMQAEQDPHDVTRWFTAVGPVSIRDEKFFSWRHEFGRGGAIDLVMHLKNTDFYSARSWLLRTFNINHGIGSCTDKEFSKPKPIQQNLCHIVHYLIKKRGLSDKVLSEVIASGQLYADNNRNAVFLLLGKKRTAVGAELCGTGSQPWKGMRSGSKKYLGFFYAGSPDASMCILCESAIDALSCQIILPNCLSISTAGVMVRPTCLPILIKRGYQVYCGFDNDSAGNSAAEHMIKLNPSVERLRPSQKDWNEDLLKK